MAITRFICKDCGKNFERILASNDISGIFCSICHSNNLKRIYDTADYRTRNTSNTIPAGALSGGFCRSGFS